MNIKYYLIFLRYFIYRYFFFLKFKPFYTDKLCKIKQVHDSKKTNFFGYYNFNITDNNDNIIFLETSDDKTVNLIFKEGDSYSTISQTLAWNYQQGCMLNWFDHDKNQIIYNDFCIDTNGYVSKVVNNIGEEIINFPMAIQAIAVSSRLALCLNYERLNIYRPEYGYSIKSNVDFDNNEDGIWKMNLIDSSYFLLISIQSLIILEDNDLDILEAKVNHILINENENNFVFLFRYKINNIRHHRFYLSDFNGNIKLLSSKMVSHYCWKDNSNIIFFGEDNSSNEAYFTLNIHNRDINLISEKLPKTDGHPILINSRYLIIDTYPKINRFSELFLYDFVKNNITKIGEFYQPLKFSGSNRVDLHPKFSSCGTKCFIESAHLKNTRILYEINILNLLNNA